MHPTLSTKYAYVQENLSLNKISLKVAISACSTN